jgi:hypothetical protein
MEFQKNEYASEDGRLTARIRAKLPSSLRGGYGLEVKPLPTVRWYACLRFKWVGGLQAAF